MSKEQERALKLDQASASAAALVATKVMDCLIQVLKNKELLLPSEVNDIYRAADLLIAQPTPVDENDQLVQHLARADLADRLGEVRDGGKADCAP
ncbi:MAG: hypothetical protein EOO81_04000 [Oxalobacteraceae bacterium]|nr:MAG: hypothetical protein EOO81_04000 [Oxalobacteraceae bacterium]